MQVKAHLVHQEPHLDEVWCDWARRKFGREKYPGSDVAEILIEGAAGHKLGVSETDLAKEGIATFGRWGGKFDEHSPETPDKCSADLVAEDLGITDHPVISKILAFVHRTDLGPAVHQLDLSSLVKFMHAVHPDNPIKVIRWAQEGLEAKFLEESARIEGKKIPTWKSTPELATELLSAPDGEALQTVMKFAKSDNHPFGLGRIASAMRAVYPNDPNKTTRWATEAFQAIYQDQLAFQEAREIVSTSQWENFSCHSTSLYVVMAQTDNRKFSAAARAKGAGVVIQRRSSGNVQIYPNQNVKQLGFRIKMHQIARAIRLAEQQKKGKSVTTDPKILESEGMVAGAEEWYYTGEKKGQFLLNGSTTAQNDPTKLDDETIINLVGKNVQVIF